jgi:hypothetical protein
MLRLKEAAEDRQREGDMPATGQIELATLDIADEVTVAVPDGGGMGIPGMGKDRAPAVEIDARSACQAGGSGPAHPRHPPVLA